MKLLRAAFVAALFLIVCATGHGDPPAKAPSPPDAKYLDAGAKAFVAKNCLECHSGAKPKGGVALDKLTADLADKANREVWVAALEQIKAGGMPPEKQPRPDAKEAAALQEWVNGRLEAAETE